MAKVKKMRVAFSMGKNLAINLKRKQSKRKRMYWERSDAFTKVENNIRCKTEALTAKCEDLEIAKIQRLRLNINKPTILT